MELRETKATGTAGRGLYRRSRATRGGLRPVLASALAASLLAACAAVPVTGRQSANLFSPEDDVALGGQAYEEILAPERIVTSGPQKEMVERVMQRLVAVADDSGYQWEVRLIQNDEVVNAFALPGGKMAVYTGILPVTQDETGLAVVMGHEIGHVVARHGTERMTQQIGADMIAQWAAGRVGGDPQLWDLGKSLMVSLPWGRKQELEADHIGLIYMAKAGYDPRRAADFWKRMSQGGGGAPPEWLSTHPSDERRIHQIEGLLPEAVKVYQATGATP